VKKATRLSLERIAAAMELASSEEIRRRIAKQTTPPQRRID
jgi:hypothetical protein